MALVCSRGYRTENLAGNGVDIRPSRSRLPNLVLSHAGGMGAGRDSPGLAPEELDAHLDTLDKLASDCYEMQFNRFLEKAVFPDESDLTFGEQAGLQIGYSIVMPTHLVPGAFDMFRKTEDRIARPKPDLLYGYTEKSFTDKQRLAQRSLHPRSPNSTCGVAAGIIRFPFLAVEVKAVGSTGGGGGLWVATNQCAGASTTCLAAVKLLNDSVASGGGKIQVDEISYSIAVDNYLALLYVSWREDSRYCVQRVRSFLLSEPDQFVDFRKHVRNILDWGRKTRLSNIGRTLDTLADERASAQSLQAKLRDPPYRVPTEEQFHAFQLIMHDLQNTPPSDTQVPLSHAVDKLVRAASSLEVEKSRKWFQQKLLDGLSEELGIVKVKNRFVCNEAKVEAIHFRLWLLCAVLTKPYTRRKLATTT